MLAIIVTFSYRSSTSNDTWRCAIDSLSPQFAVCRYVPRANAMPRLCALLPQVSYIPLGLTFCYQFEEVNEDGVQVAPPGFHLIPLPFADDLRHIDLSESHPDVEDAASQFLSMIVSLC